MPKLYVELVAYIDLQRLAMLPAERIAHKYNKLSPWALGPLQIYVSTDHRVIVEWKGIRNITSIERATPVAEATKHPRRSEVSETLSDDTIESLIRWD